MTFAFHQLPPELIAMIISSSLPSDPCAPPHFDAALHSSRNALLLSLSLFSFNWLQQCRRLLAKQIVVRTETQAQASAYRTEAVWIWNAGNDPIRVETLAKLCGLIKGTETLVLKSFGEIDLSCLANLDLFETRHLLLLETWFSSPLPSILCQPAPFALTVLHIDAFYDVSGTSATTFSLPFAYLISSSPHLEDLKLTMSEASSSLVSSFSLPHSDATPVPQKDNANLSEDLYPLTSSLKSLELIFRAPETTIPFDFQSILGTFVVNCTLLTSFRLTIDGPTSHPFFGPILTFCLGVNMLKTPLESLYIDADLSERNASFIMSMITEWKELRKVQMKAKQDVDFRVVTLKGQKKMFENRGVEVSWIG